MKVERWDPAKHLDLLGSWLRARKQADDAGDARMYPPTGFVIDECVIGFLYATNAPLIGYLDGVVSDPAVPAQRRFHAIEALCATLLGEARLRGIEILCAATPVMSLAGVCQDFGFKVVGTGYQYLARKE